jgi:hypothetical protein
MVSLTCVPWQPLADGVTVYITVPATVPLLVSVSMMLEPGPDGELNGAVTPLTPLVVADHV